MPLMDALRSGVDLVNASSQATQNAAKARYAYPMTYEELQRQQLANQFYAPEHQAALDYQRIINQYQPEKSRLANEYQSKQNEWYAPIADASVRNTNMTTDLMPYKTATDMEVALKSNSRYGGAFEYLKGLNSMTAAQKDMYLADPDNMRTFTSMMQVAGQGIGSEKGGASSMLGQVLTPELISRFKTLTGMTVGSGEGGLAAPLANQSVNGQPTQMGQMTQMSQAQPQAQGNQNAPPVIINNPQPQQGGLSAPLSNVLPPRPYLTNFSDMPMAAPAQGGIARPNQPAAMQPAPPMQPQAAPIPAPKQPQPGEKAVAPATNEQKAEAEKLGINPDEAEEIGKNATNEKLSPSERTQLGFQTLANQKAAGMPITNRAQGAIVFEKFLDQNKEKIAPALRSAAKNAGIYGQSAMGLERFRKEKPQEYQDYLFVTRDLIPNFSFNIKVMEKLASSNQQMKQLTDTYNSSLSWYSDPETAIKNLNRTIDMFGGEARAVLETAQPMYPGTLEKLNGIKPMSGDYLDTSHPVDQVQILLPDGRNVWGARKNSDQVLKLYPGAKVVQ